ncbi:MAG: DUF3617 family protein [Sphingopyxis sp.]|nr:DUF3617 family protein [Sphingopyxis sp.]
MKNALMLAVAVGFALAGCGDKGAEGEGDKAAANAPPEKPQPGSWARKIEVVELTGEDVQPNAKDQVNAMFAELGAGTVCMTPELAEQMDIGKHITDLASQGGDCRFERQVANGSKVDFAATCQIPGGQMRVEGRGTSGKTQQDVRTAITGLKPDGTVRGKMVWHVTGERKGECGPDDIVLPNPAAPVAKR